MRLTKLHLKRIIKEELEKVMGKEEDSSRLIKKLKSRLESMEGTDDSGYGGWRDKKGTSWYYDDAEGGYYNELDVDFSDPKSIKVSGSTGEGSHGSEKTFALNSEEDLKEIIKYAEKVSGLTAGSGDDDEDEED